MVCERGADRKPGHVTARAHLQSTKRTVFDGLLVCDSHRPGHVMARSHLHITKRSVFGDLLAWG